tara:strand:- start:972 stop:1205 length:234 start_codon:yes stop_codon:yes gene_type:complete
MDEKIANMAIKDVIEQYPEIGRILEKHGIRCTTCKVGICKLKDVVKIHYLGKEKEKIIFDEIDNILKRNANNKQLRK